MIYKAAKEDLNILAGLAILLWPEHTLDDLRNELFAILDSSDAAFYIIRKDGQPVG
jgi:hypothetical protein